MSTTPHGHHIPYSRLEPSDKLVEKMDCGGPTDCQPCAYFSLNHMLLNGLELIQIFKDAEKGAEGSTIVTNIVTNLVMPAYTGSGDKIGTVSRFVQTQEGLVPVLDKVV